MPGIYWYNKLDIEYKYIYLFIIINNFLSLLIKLIHY